MGRNTETIQKELSEKKFLTKNNQIAPLGISTNDLVAMYLKEIGRTPLLSAKEEVNLACRMERGDKVAKRQLTEANLRLVIKVAKRYEGQGLPFLDLIQEGNIGLMKAVERYDYRKGFKFSTYAMWWIHQAVSRGVSDKGKVIRKPTYVIEKMNQISYTQRRLQLELERNPTIDEIGQQVNLSVEAVSFMLGHMEEPTALEAPIKVDEESNLSDFISNPTSVSPFEQTCRNDLKATLNEVLNTLKEQEKKVIQLRFGLQDGYQYTLREIGKIFGLTKERIRQIEEKAIRKLRHSTRSKWLRDFLK